MLVALFILQLIPYRFMVQISIKCIKCQLLSTLDHFQSNLSLYALERIDILYIPYIHE